MDRTRESLRDEILQLDEASQAWLASEIENHLSESTHQQVWLVEVKRRDAEWDTGRIKPVDPSDAIRRARKIVEAKRSEK